MAQHLSPEVLFHIFTNFSSPDQYLNGLMLVCRDWYEVTNYEMFWLATLKNLMKQQIHDCKNNENFETLIDTSRTNMVVKQSDIVKERKNYLSSIEKREKILVIDLKPFTKRRETNDDIYGNSYKTKSVQFIRERRRRLVVLELAQIASKFENDIIDPHMFQNDWEKIINQIENSKYYDKKFIANLGVFNSSTTIFHIFLKQFQVHFHRGGDFDFLDRVVSFFLYDCELSVSSYMEHIVKTSGFNSFLKVRENKPTIFERFKNEFYFTGKSGVPAHFLSCVISSADLKDEMHFEFIRKCIELFKTKKLLKFKENMVEPYITEYMQAIIPNWMTMELYLNDMNMLECKGVNSYLFIHELCQKAWYLSQENSNSIVAENLKRANKELGLKLDIPIPRSVTNRSNIEILKVLVENGADINSPPPTLSDSTQSYHIGVPLARIIYNCYTSSRTEEILYMIEEGATLPPMDTPMPTPFYESYTYADIFDYYFDTEENNFLPTLKLLVEKFGARFTGAVPVIENVRYASNAITFSGLCELLRYLKQVTTMNKEIICTPLTYIYCDWGRSIVKDDLDKKELFREFLENEMDIHLVEEIIEEHVEVEVTQDE
ncbi:hypothetical protein NAEGRDRAFT_48307 [Naegleria gruberi]|uniref:F-box domain-containing protein n=1 Tax=Naegleria gruberi TaxID=5762 RepID=D2VBY5_NAEGR|nr:uncharacterized protein NAEGRDRAFT_48307 [Naegleria gruberi]EFC45559.1 hypothetical protein NAEGRDRAFT_48307 [Naegleria gruberi]|eukprot:XP_002678303.1 hypothetical protein NAEGRDRAFT_48307 [Naegleria gruberi strain NEG-M]